MKLQGLSITALALLLAGPAFAGGHCGSEMTTDADGDCVMIESEAMVMTMDVADDDNPGMTTEVEVEAESHTPADDPDAGPEVQ